METQEFELITPLGAGVLLFSRLAAREALSQVSEFDFEWLSEHDDLDLDQLLGQRVSLRLHLPTHGARYFTGYITRFAHDGTRGRYHAYRAEVRTWPWFLSRTTDCRIFQHQTVPDIVKTVFAEHGAIAEVRDALTASYRTREYCVQYRETDLAFVSRLLEEEGIYYYFEHAETKNTLVLADAHSAHEPFPGYAALDYRQSLRGGRDEGDYVTAWHYSRAVQSGKTTLRDFDFTKPSVKLEAQRSEARGHAEAQHERYDYPGEFQEHGDGAHYAQVRLHEQQAQYETTAAETGARGLCVGYLFTLKGHVRSDQNREYLVTQATTQLQTAGFESGISQDDVFACQFTALHSRQEYRPPRLTPTPKIAGPQTAIVVGPAGDEIYTDNYGRVKVQFHWDRLGGRNENSSCWVRVSHPWAGKNFGFIAIPRIGQEVIVEFLEGDPDQPIITGRVYNAEQMPPWELPANKTQSGMLTRSSLGGTPANANAIRFEDKIGEEQLWLHAEKDQLTEVEHDEDKWVGHDRRKTVDHDETNHIKHDRTETVDHDETITVHHDRTETVDNNETITIHNNRQERVDHNETISIGDHRQEDVGKNETIAIGMNRSETVGLNETVVIGKNQSSSIGDNQSLSVGQSRSKQVGKHEQDKIGKNWSIKVGKMKTETIGMAYMQNVGLGKMINIGGAYSTNVGLARMDVVGMSWMQQIGQTVSISAGKKYTITAGEELTITVGKSSLVMKADGSIEINGAKIQTAGTDNIVFVSPNIHHN